ncbi:vinorine synthase-like [Hevea brasiliensis]|nr:vinorine synthase-like [Hevea brasiliensis]
MAEAMKVEIVSREMIKPSSPTSPELKIFKLSLIDQLHPSLFTPILLFYSTNNNSIPAANKSQHLKSSLSKYLTLFYPLAGRIKDDSSINCDDEGIVYIEAHVNCPLSGILKQPPQVEVLEPFLPGIDQSIEVITDQPLLFVQENLFTCGGIAIGLHISHKIADAATIVTFLNGWATVAADGSRGILVPNLTASSVLPPLDSTPKLPAVAIKAIASKPATRRLVFDASSIAALQAKVASSSVPNPTRVEAVTAIIWKHSTKASRLNSGFSKLSMAFQAVNIRKRIVQSLPENAVGNILGSYSVLIREKIELQSLVSSLRKGLQEFIKSWLEHFQRNDLLSAILGHVKEISGLPEQESTDFYNFSSWCKMPLYEADFGWGKPTWVAIPIKEPYNVSVIMDTRDGGGIEAWLCLSEEDIAFLEHDEELLTYATFNPSII